MSLFERYDDARIATEINPDRANDSGPDEGLTLTAKTNYLLLKLQTPEDVCKNVWEALYILVFAHMQPYSNEHSESCLGTKFDTFRVQTNWPLAETDQVGYAKYGDVKKSPFKAWQGLTSLRRAKPGAEGGDENVGGSGWDLTDSYQLYISRVVAGGEPYKLTGQFIGRRDLLKELLSDPDFPDEFSRRLRVDIEDVRRVTRLALQAIQNAKEDKIANLEFALEELLGDVWWYHPDRYVCAYPSEEMTSEEGDVGDEIKEYIVLSWMQTLGTEEKLAAAKKIAEIARRKAGKAKRKSEESDDDIAARLLVSYAKDVYRYSAQTVGLPRGACTVGNSHKELDLYKIFPDENDLLWSVFLDEEVIGICPKLKKLLEDKPKQSTLRVQDVRAAISS